MRAVLVGLVGAVLAVGGAQALGSEYEGTGSDPGGYKWQLYAKFTPAPAGRLKINVQATSATCTSMVDGSGELVGDTIKFDGDCSMTMTVKGRKIQIKEHPNCASFHGASCTYDGALSVMK